VTIRYSYEPSEEGSAARLGRLYISAKKVEWSVVSGAKEMAHAMLLNKPLFKAVQMDLIVSFHWKCPIDPVAHHMTQFLVSAGRNRVQKTLRRNATLISAVSAFQSVRDDFIVPVKAGAQASPVPGGAGGTGHASPVAGAAPALRKPGGSGLLARLRDAGLFSASTQKLDLSGPEDSAAAGVDADEAGCTPQQGSHNPLTGAGGEPPQPQAEMPEEAFDTYRLFRSSALALTVRVGTVAAHSVLHPPPPPLPRTKWTRRVPHPVLIGHAASLTPY